MWKFFKGEFFVFWIVFHYLNAFVLVQVNNIVLVDAYQGMLGEIMGIVDDGTGKAVVQHYGRAQEGILDALQDCHADSRVQLGVHLLRDFGNGRKRSLAHKALSFSGDIVVQISNGNNPCILMNFFPFGGKREAAAVHAFMVLQCRQLDALRNLLVFIQQVGAVNSMLHITLKILTIQGFYPA